MQINKKFTPEELKQRQKEQLRKSQLKHREKRIKECRDYYKKNLKKMREKNRTRYLKNKEIIKQERTKIYEELIELNLLTDCIICGFSKEKYIVIDFHHIEPENKKFAVSQLIKIKSRKKDLLEEIKKCVCMCANCHRLFHDKDEDTIIKFNEVMHGII